MKKSITLALVASFVLAVSASAAVDRLVEKTVALAAGSLTNTLVNTGQLDWQILAAYATTPAAHTTYTATIAKDGITRFTGSLVTNTTTLAFTMPSNPLFLAPGESNVITRAAGAAITNGALSILFVVRPVRNIGVVEKSADMAAGARTNTLTNTGALDWLVTDLQGTYSSAALAAHSLTIVKDGVVRKTIAQTVSNAVFNTVLDDALFLAPAETALLIRPTAITNASLNAVWTITPFKNDIQ